MMLGPNDFLFSLAVDRARFGPNVKGIKQNALRQNQKFEAIIQEIGKAEKKRALPPHLGDGEVEVKVRNPDGKEVDTYVAEVTKVGVYSSPAAAMIVGQATIPGVDLPPAVGDAFSIEMREYLEAVLNRIFKVEGEGFDTNIDLLPYTWVIVPLQKLCEQEELIVAGMGAESGG